MDVAILAIQAQVLLWTGLLCMGAGLWLEIPPMTMAWRSAVAAVVAMWIAGRLLRIAADAIGERMASETEPAEAAPATATARATPAAARRR